jgi:ATP-dependent helicase HrpA
VIDSVESASARHRSRAAGVDEEAVFAFYDARVPPEVHDGRAFERWRKEAERDDPRRLFLSREDVARPDTPDAAGDLFPDHLEVGGLALPLAYRFRLGHPEDGVTATVPLHALNTLAPGRFEWLVPGMLRDKAGFLLKSLPRRYRREVMPWTRWAGAFAEEAAPGDTPLTEALAAFLKARCGVEVPPEAWETARLPDHLLMRFVVVDAGGAEVGAGRDLAGLQAELGGAARAGFAALPKAEFERTGATNWDFGDLPESVSFGSPERPAHGHPALVDRGDAVDLVLLEDPEAARRATRDGLLRLAVLRLPKALAQPKQVPLSQAACLHYAPLGPCEALKADLHRAVLTWLFFEAGDDVRTRADFEARVAHVRAELGPALAEAARAVTDALARHHALATALAAPGLRGDPESLADLREHLGMLVFPGFAARTPHARLLHLPRHLTALAVRLERLQANPARDRKAVAAIAPLWRAYRERVAEVGPDAPGLAGFRDLLEELRVSLFAQEVGTAVPVSVPRLERAWKEIAG